MNGWMDGWVDGWVNDIENCPEVRESDIINVNNCLPNPYVYDIPKNDFIPQHIISLQMNVIFQDYFCLWRLLLKVIWKYYFKFNYRIILKLYNNTASILHYFIRSSKKIKPNVFTKVFSPKTGLTWLLSLKWHICHQRCYAYWDESQGICCSFWMTIPKTVRNSWN